MKSKAHWIVLLGLMLVASSIYAVLSKTGWGRTTMILSMFIICVTPLILLIYQFETKASNTRLLCTLGVMVAISVVMRQMLHGIGPSPVFLFAIVTGYVFGPIPGFITGATTLAVSNFMVGGHGPWSLFQITAMGFVGLFSAYAKAPWQRFEIVVLCIYGFIAGVCYGVFTDLSNWLFFTPEHTLATYVAVVARGIGFDLAYGIGNVLLILLIGAPLIKILKRFEKRMIFQIRSF